MTTLLHIDASARTSRSLSRSLSERFVSGWMARRPSDGVIVRDVGRHPPPITTELWIGSVFTPEGERTDELAMRSWLPTNWFLNSTEPKLLLWVPQCITMACLRR